MANKKQKGANKAIRLVLMLFIVCTFIYFYLNPESKPNNLSTSDLEVIAIPYTDEQTVKHTGYTLLYSEENEQAFWVAYVLTPEEVNSPSVDRKDNFREDPYISTGSAKLSDYKGSGYDRGHLIPFADLSWSEEAASDSFYLSNMSPQNSSFNRGKWALLEEKVRSFAKKDPICVVTGPVLSDGPFEKIGLSEVSVPKYFYKVILDFNNQKAIGFVLPNEKCDNDLSFYAVSVDYVEALTGIDFFYLLEDSLENKLEAMFDYSIW